LVAYKRAVRGLDTDIYTLKNLTHRPVGRGDLTIVNNTDPTGLESQVGELIEHQKEEHAAAQPSSIPASPKPEPDVVAKSPRGPPPVSDSPEQKSQDEVEEVVAQPKAPPGAEEWKSIVCRLLYQYTEIHWDNDSPDVLARHLIQCAMKKDMRLETRTRLSIRQIQAVFNFATVFHGNHEAELKLSKKRSGQIHSTKLSTPREPDAQLRKFCKQYLLAATDKDFAASALQALKVLLAVCRTGKHRGVGVAEMAAIKLACNHLLDHYEKAGISVENHTKLTQTLAKASGNAGEKAGRYNHKRRLGNQRLIDRFIRESIRCQSS